MNIVEMLSGAGGSIGTWLKLIQWFLKIFHVVLVDVIWWARISWLCFVVHSFQLYETAPYDLINSSFCKDQHSPLSFHFPFIVCRFFNTNHQLEDRIENQTLAIPSKLNVVVVITVGITDPLRVSITSKKSRFV